MAGVSVGWFTPTDFFPDVDRFVRQIRKVMPFRHKSWPLAVSSIRQRGRGTGVAYAIVGGHIPIHIDSIGLDDSDGNIFQFVLHVENRPALLTAPATDQNTPVLQGFAPPDVNPLFGMGGIELRAGMAVHFDITKHFHGVTSLPTGESDMNADHSPKAVIIQVSGFLAANIEAAVEHAKTMLLLDEPWWDPQGLSRKGLN